MLLFTKYKNFAFFICQFSIVYFTFFWYFLFYTIRDFGSSLKKKNIWGNKRVSFESCDHWVLWRPVVDITQPAIPGQIGSPTNQEFQPAPECQRQQYFSCCYRHNPLPKDHLGILSFFTVYIFWPSNEFLRKSMAFS